MKYIMQVWDILPNGEIEFRACQPDENTFAILGEFERLELPAQMFEDFQPIEPGEFFCLQVRKNGTNSSTIINREDPAKWLKTFNDIPSTFEGIEDSPFFDEASNLTEGIDRS